MQSDEYMNRKSKKQRGEVSIRIILVRIRGGGEEEEEEEEEEEGGGG